MAKTVTPGGILKIQANPRPESSSEVSDLVLQVLDLVPRATRCTFTASDGTMKLKAILPWTLTSEVITGRIQNLGLIRILDYSLIDSLNKMEKHLMVTKCEVVSPALKMEIKNVVKSEESGNFPTSKQQNDCESEVKTEKAGILLKPKPEMFAKSAAEIVNEQGSKMESQTSQTGRATSKKRLFRSEVWDHFTLIESRDPEDPKAKCNYCGQQYACHSQRNGTSSMNKHLRVCKKHLAGHSKKEKTLKQTTLSFVKIEGECSNMMFTQSMGVNYLARMFIIDDLPIRLVESESFKELVKYFQSSFIMPSCKMIRKEIDLIYNKEKKQLMEYIKKSSQKMCLSIDMWTSGQTKCYMILTGHFVDSDWKLQKKILNFRQVDNHKDETMANMLEKCLLEWGIDKVFTIIFDKSFSNDFVGTHLFQSPRHVKSLMLDGACIRICCFTDILNLIANDGLNEHQRVISKVRKAVKYVKSSSEQLQQFKDCRDSLNITFKENVSLDVPTQWNTTYLMLENAEKYSKVFEKLGECDKDFISYMEEDGPPTIDDWLDIQELCKLLKVFYNTTLRVSASLPITTNMYMIELCEMKMTIQKYVKGENMVLRRMALGMMSKFDKYWVNFEKINSLFFVAVLLDPRCKRKFFKYCIDILFGSDQATDFIKRIETLIERLYKEYKGDDETCPRIVPNPPKNTDILWATFFESMLEEDTSSNMSEVEEYLSDKVVKNYDNFDILEWWKLYSYKYPILSEMARDVLVIPISTMASESAFSTVNSSGASLWPSTVEAIICTRSWIRSKTPVSESVDFYETIDEELAAITLQDLEEDEN